MLVAPCQELNQLRSCTNLQGMPWPPGPSESWSVQRWASHHHWRWWPSWCDRQTCSNSAIQHMQNLVQNIVCSESCAILWYLVHNLHMMDNALESFEITMNKFQLAAGTFPYQTMQLLTTRGDKMCHHSKKIIWISWMFDDTKNHHMFLYDIIWYYYGSRFQEINFIQLNICTTSSSLHACAAALELWWWLLQNGARSSQAIWHFRLGDAHLHFVFHESFPEGTSLTLTTCICHGYGVYMFLGEEGLPAGANWILEIAAQFNLEVFWLCAVELVQLCWPLQQGSQRRWLCMGSRKTARSSLSNRVFS